MKDTGGQLEAACDWWLVDELGRWDARGLYVFINQLEVNPGLNLHRVRRQLVKEIGTLVPHAIGVYWERRDRFSNRSHAFRRNQLQQLREEVRV